MNDKTIAEHVNKTSIENVNVVSLKFRSNQGNSRVTREVFRNKLYDVKLVTACEYLGNTKRVGILYVDSNKADYNIILFEFVTGTNNLDSVNYDEVILRKMLKGLLCNGVLKANNDDLIVMNGSHIPKLHFYKIAFLIKVAAFELFNQMKSLEIW